MRHCTNMRRRRRRVVVAVPVNPVNPPVNPEASVNPPPAAKSCMRRRPGEPGEPCEPSVNPVNPGETSVNPPYSSPRRRRRVVVFFPVCSLKNTEGSGTSLPRSCNSNLVVSKAEALVGFATRRILSD